MAPNGKGHSLLNFKWQCNSGAADYLFSFFFFFNFNDPISYKQDLALTAFFLDPQAKKIYIAYVRKSWYLCMVLLPLLDIVPLE